MARAKINRPPENKLRVEPDSVRSVTTDSFALAATVRACLAAYYSQRIVDEFIAVVERLTIASKQISIGAPDVLAVTLADVESAIGYYQIALAVAESRPATLHRDFLRQFRDLKESPTKQRLENIPKRETDELRPAESAIRFAIYRLRLFNNGIPSDWVKKLGDNTELLREVAETVCAHFSYKIDRRGRPRNTALDAYADRLLQIYEALTGKRLTYAKGTGTEHLASSRRERNRSRQALRVSA